MLMVSHVSRKGFCFLQAYFRFGQLGIIYPSLTLNAFTIIKMEIYSFLSKYGKLFAVL